MPPENFRKKMDLSLYYFHVIIYNPVKQKGAIDVSEVSSNFCFWYSANLGKLINFYCPWNHQKTISFLMILGGIEINLRWNLRSDNLTLFKWFIIIFSLGKWTIQFSFLFRLYFQQKWAPKMSISHSLMKSSACVFDITKRYNGFFIS